MKMKIKAIWKRNKLGIIGLILAFGSRTIVNVFVSIADRVMPYQYNPHLDTIVAMVCLIGAITLFCIDVLKNLLRLTNSAAEASAKRKHILLAIVLISLFAGILLGVFLMQNPQLYA
ncbi:MAG: hypothetical protein FWF04_02590 [Clostridiales bacterium]|nr:hypothetical protein [Clostridiales bacterium]